ncbi:MAG: hypothetical protein V3U92_09810 [Cellulophaga sp.]
MKKCSIHIGIIFVTLFLLYTSVEAQIDPNLLIGVHNVTDAEMNTIVNPITGSLVYNTTKGSIMQYNGSSWDKLLEGGGGTTPRVTALASNYTVASTDNGNVFTFNSATDVTITIASGLSVGFNISIYQIGNGKVNIVGASGVTIKNRLSRYKTAGKDAGAGIICTASNTFHVTGDLKL